MKGFDSENRIDETVRAALTAESASASRITQRALVSPARRWPRFALVTAGTAAMTAIAWLLQPASVPAPPPAPDPSTAFRIVNHGDVVGAIDPRGRSFALGGLRTPESGSRRLFFVYGGDS